MPSEEESAYCKECRQNVLCRRQVPNHLVHALVTLFLCGTWLPVWFLVAVFGKGKWRCAYCGSTDLYE